MPLRISLVTALVVLAACPPKTPYNGPIEYVGGTDPHPGVPGDHAKPACSLVTEASLIRPFLGDIPDGLAEDDVFNGALQFLITAGGRIESQDPVAHTIISGRVVGQTLASTCSLNQYRSYVFRIAVIGQRMLVTMDCIGYTGRSWHPDSAGRCDGEYIGKMDAELPRTIFEGAVGMVKMRRMGTPRPPPPPALFRPANSGVGPVPIGCAQVMPPASGAHERVWLLGKPRVALAALVAQPSRRRSSSSASC